MAFCHHDPKISIRPMTELCCLLWAGDGRLPLTTRSPNFQHCKHCNLYQLYVLIRDIGRICPNAELGNTGNHSGCKVFVPWQLQQAFLAFTFDLLITQYC